MLPTIRNARGSDLIVTRSDESIFFGIPSKALGKRHAVPLGRHIENLRSEWWVITVHANSDSPICYVMKLDEVRALASQDKNGGAFWLEPRAYATGPSGAAVAAKSVLVRLVLCRLGGVLVPTSEYRPVWRDKPIFVS